MSISEYNKEQLKDYIENASNIDGDISAILSNPYFDEELYHMAIKKIKKKDSISTFLNLPYLNSESLKTLVDQCEPDTTLFISFLRSPLLTQEIYNQVLAKHPIGIDDLLLQSRFASDKTCIELLSYTTIKKETYLKVIDSPFFNIKVIDKILEKFPVDNEIVLKMLEKAVATPEQIDRLFELCTTIERRGTYKASIEYMIDNCPCNIERVSQYAVTNFDTLKFVINSKQVTPELLLHLAQKITLKAALILMDSPKITEEVMQKLIEKNYSEADELYMKIVNRQEIGEDTLCLILNKTTNPIIKDKILKHPSAGVNTKILIIVKKTNLTKEELDTLFAMPDLSQEHIIELLKKHPTIEIYRRAINSSLVSQPFYHSVIECIYEKKIQNYMTIINELLEKDLDESNLCYILSFQGDYELVKKVLSHPNAGLGVYKKVMVLADKMTEKQRDEIVQQAAQIKHSIMAKTFEIEEELNYTEMLRRNVEDGISTMLWGPSGVGKTSRVFQIDPDPTQLILKNGMLPEVVVGGKEANGEPGEIYPPHWYKVLCRKCEAEPDKKHILFIDEITNVSDTIKNLVWEIVGSRLVNGNEEWPLPENCSIVLAGNRPEESTAVRLDALGGAMPAPLHNRTCSMIEIKFNIDEWQEWALSINPKTGKPRIHPIVFSFCVPHADSVMFTQFDPQNITQPFLTPRKWETLSDVIYCAERRGPMHHVSTARIKSILGDNSICSAFIEHYERLPIDLNAIIMGEYNAEDFPTLDDKLYALGIIIAQYDGDQETIESFILECLGDEFLSVYNSIRKPQEDTDSVEQTINGGRK